MVIYVHFQKLWEAKVSSPSPSIAIALPRSPAPERTSHCQTHQQGSQSPQGAQGPKRVRHGWSQGSNLDQHHLTQPSHFVHLLSFFPRLCHRCKSFKSLTLRLSMHFLLWNIVQRFLSGSHSGFNGVLWRGVKALLQVVSSVFLLSGWTFTSYASSIMLLKKS